ncbi:hypothetical protein D777_01037 [Marinobacter nitratireducens]|uniref:Uncharacterized protein n=1 Tax=Marinobacter nitratireducens TaxID=1137280 RepID=A0A072N5Z8_9GAMM|nr:hypothetical protein [Marinobacter nitratireducens]KEF32403.1 hypothetical protein D777_01037 [Marinobacter nitratireducens]
MAYALVLITQAGLVALLGVLALRMVALSRSEPLAAASYQDASATAQYRWSGSQKAPVSTLDRTELFTQLHILAGLQERDCRVQGLNLAEAPELVRCYAAAWLYGAACSLCDKSVRHSESLIELVTYIANRKTGLAQSTASQAIQSIAASSMTLACFRGGLEGAEFWSRHHYVSPEQSLYQAITANAFI